MTSRTKRMNRDQKSAANTADLQRPVRPKKTCLFCDNKTEASYTDSVVLKKFISDRAKIVGRSRTGLCSKHQRQVTQQIKYARHLSLLPFIARV